MLFAWTAILFLSRTLSDHTRTTDNRFRPLLLLIHDLALDPTTQVALSSRRGEREEPERVGGRGRPSTTFNMTSRPPNRQSSIASQRQSTDRRSSLRTSNPDVFSDDFALESLDVADGHNPSSAHAMPAEPSSQPCTTPQRSRSTYTIPEPSLDTSQDKGSQPPDRGGSFTPQHDAPTIQHPQRALSVASGSETSDITSLPQGHLSTSSTFSMPRTQSPYQGATGPSHPYAMYPQDIGMTRTPSVATNSTIGMPDRAYPRTLGPTHPYGMYSQNTVPEGDVSPIAAPNSSIPVGFPGLGQNYQRRLGPDGEDAADIIGPDGHTEQLPPYTRYPDGVLLKDTPPRLANTTNETPDPYTSQDTIQPAHSPVSVTQSHLTEDSGTRLNVPAAIPVARTDESGSFKEKWTKKGKRRMCKGKIPVWVVVIVVILLVLAGALLGGIIGRFIGRRRAQQATGDASPQAIQTTPYVCSAVIVDDRH